MKKIVKKVITFILSFVMIFSCFSVDGLMELGTFISKASAATEIEGKSGSLTFSFDESTGTLTFVGDGNMENYVKRPLSSKINSPWYSYRDKITHIVFENGPARYGVNRIGDYAFYGCENITSISIPRNVHQIGKDAFRDCKNLNKVYFEGTIERWCYINFRSNYSNPLFYGAEFYVNDTLISNLVIPASVSKVYDYAFYGAASIKDIVLNNPSIRIGKNSFYKTGYYLDENNWDGNLLYIGTHLINCKSDISESVSIKEGTTEIADSVFKAKTSITTVSFPESVVVIGEEAFYGCTGLTDITIPSAINRLGDYSFENCTGLINADLSDGLRYIGTGVFKGCTLLEGIAIPETVSLLGNDAFSGCTNLSYVSLPKGITTLNAGVFDDCTSLKSIKIPENVKMIYEAFSGCTALKTIILPNGLERIGKDVFNDTALYADENNWKNNVLYIGKYLIKAKFNIVTIHYVVKSETRLLADYAFEKNTALSSVVLPYGMINISEGAFSGCDSLRSVRIPNTVTKLENNCLENCRVLSSVTLPDSVSQIEYSSFKNCTSLTEISIPSSLTKITCSAFTGCTNLLQINPRAQKGYTFKGWYDSTDYSNQITEFYNSSKTLYAKWDPNPHSVFIIPNGGTYYTLKIDGEYDQTVEIPDPVKEGYTFAGWKITSSNGSVVYGSYDKTDKTYKFGDGNDIFTAQWSINNYKLDFDVNGGISEYETRVCDYQSKIKIEDPIKKGYTFIGWSNVKFGTIEKSNGFSNYTFGAGDDTIKAEWSINTYTAVLDLHGGSCFEKAQKYNYNDPISDLPVPFLEGYVFTGWYTEAIGGKKITDDTLIEDDIVLHAHWERRIYKISLDPNGGICNQKEVNVKFEDTFTLPVPTKEGYSFVGWYTEKDGGNEVNGKSPAVQDLTIYAQWKSIAVISAENQNVKSGETVSIPFSISGNPGVMGYEIDLNYDSSVFTPISVTVDSCFDKVLDNDTINSSIGYIENGKLKIVWIACENITYDGTMFSVQFKVSENAKSGSNIIGVTYDTDNTFDEKWESVTFSCNDVVISIENPGDVNLTELYIEDMSTFIGENFSIPLNINNQCGLKSADVMLLYDADIFQYINVKSDKAKISVLGEAGKLNIKISEMDLHNDGEAVLWLVFKPLKLGISEFKLSDNLGNLKHCKGGFISALKNPNIKTTIYADPINVDVGENIRIPIKINGNTGIMSYTIFVKYDFEFLESLSVEKNPDLGGTFDYNVEKTAGEIKIIWINSSDYLNDGCILYLNFKVLKQGKTRILLSYSQEDTFNENWEDVHLDCKDVKIYVMEMLYPVKGTTTAVDNKNNFVYGVPAGIISIDDYVYTEEDCTLSTIASKNGFGTGTSINVISDDEIVKTYSLVLFGDVNGDGWYDGRDAVTVSMIANGMLTREQVGEAVWMAADCNHDGKIDQADVDLLNQAGLLLSSVDQTKPTEELLETSSEYNEYLNLIDQSVEVKSDEPENDETEVPLLHKRWIDKLIDFILYVIKNIIMIYIRIY